MRLLKGNERGVNLLVLDAGSLAGVLSQLHIIDNMMRKLENKSETKEGLLPSSHFDLIGGSGIAGFAALCLGPLMMSAEETIQTLQILGISVFYRNTDARSITVFNSDDLRETLRGIIETAGHSPDAIITKISANPQSKAVCFVSPLVDSTSCHRLRSYRCRKGTLECTILDVALASISTVGMFEHAEIGSRRQKYTSVGIHYTNPIQELLDEAEVIFGAEQRVSCVLSLGAGASSQSFTPFDYSWASLDVHALLQAMDIQQRVITGSAERRFGNLEAYFRLSVDGIGSRSLDEWIHWDAEQVEACVQAYLENPTYLKELNAAIDQILRRTGSSTLNQLNHAKGGAVVAKVIPPVTQYFVLRRKAWDFIEKNLVPSPRDQRVVFVISGMGGSGKSTLLSHYVQVYGSRYSHIFLIDASSVHSIKIDLQNAVRSLGEEHSQKTWEQALRHFSEDHPDKHWLIAYDNADDPSIPLREYMPESDHGTIFITSRNRDLCFLTSGNLHWELGPMTGREALDALLRSANRNESPSESDLQDAETLAERLGRLPLALVQAGTYCFQKTEVVDGIENVFTFGQYLEALDQNHHMIMHHPVSQSLDQYGRSVYATLNLSYLELPDIPREFLHLCGYFHQSNISLLMLEYAAESDFQQPDKLTTPETNDAVESKLRSLLQVRGKSTTIHLHKIIFSLRMFSLVRTSMTTNSLMINYHPLVHTWSCDILSPANADLYSAMATRVVSTCIDPKFYLVRNFLVPHIQEILQRPAELHINDMAAFAETLTWDCTPVEGEKLYRKLFHKCSREFGRDHEFTLTVQANLALAIKNQGRYSEAERLERDALEKKKKLFPGNKELILATQFNLAGSYLKLEKWKEAEKLLQECLVIAEAKSGWRSQDVMKVLHNMSILFDRQGLHFEGLTADEEALDIGRSVLGKDHPDTLSSMANLAVRYKKLKRFADAEKLEQEVVEVSTQTNGRNHPDTLMAMHNLANTYQLQYNFDESTILREETLERYRRVLGNGHPSTLESISSLAFLYYEIGRREEGIKLQEELDKLEGGLGPISLKLWQELETLNLI